MVPVENVKTSIQAVRAVYDAWCAADPARACEHLDPEVVWEAIEDAPDAGTYRGHAGVKRYMEDWLGDFEDFEFELAQPVEAGDRLVLEQRARNRGKGSGLTTEIQYGAVYTFRDGKVLTVNEYGTYSKALEAVGLSGPAMSENG